MQDVTIRSTVYLISIMGIFCLSAHFLACIWTSIGRFGNKTGKANWLQEDYFTGDLQGFTHHNTKHGPKSKSVYVAAYYYVFTVISSASQMLAELVAFGPTPVCLRSCFLPLLVVVRRGFRRHSFLE